MVYPTTYWKGPHSHLNHQLWYFTPIQFDIIWQIWRWDCLAPKYLQLLGETILYVILDAGGRLKTPLEKIGLVYVPKISSNQCWVWGDFPRCMVWILFSYIVGWRRVLAFAQTSSLENCLEDSTRCHLPMDFQQASSFEMGIVKKNGTPKHP